MPRYALHVPNLPEGTIGYICMPTTQTASTSGSGLLTIPAVKTNSRVRTLPAKDFELSDFELKPGDFAPLPAEKPLSVRSLLSRPFDRIKTARYDYKRGKQARLYLLHNQFDSYRVRGQKKNMDEKRS